MNPRSLYKYFFAIFQIKKYPFPHFPPITISVSNNLLYTLTLFSSKRSILIFYILYKEKGFSLFVGTFLSTIWHILFLTLRIYSLYLYSHFSSTRVCHYFILLKNMWFIYLFYLFLFQVSFGGKFDDKIVSRVECLQTKIINEIRVLMLAGIFLIQELGDVFLARLR